VAGKKSGFPPNVGKTNPPLNFSEQNTGASSDSPVKILALV